MSVETRDRPFYATAEQVREMRRAAIGLTVGQMRAALTAMGVPAPRGLGSVRSCDVGQACTALTLADTGRVLSSFGARSGSDQSLQHADAVDDWPPAPETETERWDRARREMRDKILQDEAKIEEALRAGHLAQTGREANDVELERLRVASQGLKLDRVVALVGQTWGLALVDVLSEALR